MLASSGMETDMHKKYMAAVILMACFLTACAQKPDSEERGGIRVAVGDNSYNGSQGEGGEAGRQPDGTQISPDGKTASESGTAPDSLSIGSGQAENPSHSAGKEVSEILAGCAGVKIEQTITAMGGTTLLIDADVNVDGITRVSQYEYVLKNITEEIRCALFQAVFSIEAADRAEYDERNNVWTLDIDPGIRNYFLYMISHTNGGATVHEEQIIVLENRYYDLYPFEDNRLSSASDSRVNLTLDEAASMCGQVVDSITDSGDYAVSHIQAYGKNGRRPYLRVVFKRMLDGMPVTTYNDLRFLVDNNGIEKVTGSLFSARETGLEGTILSPKEAVKKLREQAAFLNFEGESRVEVSEVALEYLVVTSPDGKVLITPVWRFLLGGDEDERDFLRQKILAIDAVTGELIWEERGETL